MHELFADFLTDARAELGRARDALARLEQDGPSREHIDDMRRGVSQIRTLSGTIGLARIAALAEATEALLTRLKANGDVSQADCTALSRGLDRLARLIAMIAATGAEPIGGDPDVLEALGDEDAVDRRNPGAIAALDDLRAPLDDAWSPIEQTFSRTCAQLRKFVTLEIESSARDLPKAIVTAIAGALQRIVRYACVYGVEPDLVRMSQAKRVPGVVRVSALWLGEEAIIAVSDDGAGLNLDRLRRRAAALKAVPFNEAANMRDENAAALVFEPRISALGEGDDESGLDRAKAIVTRAHGAIDVTTLAGRGATFLIRIPLTEDSEIKKGTSR